MDLKQNLPIEIRILDAANRVKSNFPSSKGKCEFMATALRTALTNLGVRCQQVSGNFHLDSPAAFDYISPDDSDATDDYTVNHDWITIDGKILDISADQFKQYVNCDIPKIAFIGFSDPLFDHYEELNYV
jgi:hypothetical protein